MRDLYFAEFLSIMTMYAIIGLPIYLNKRERWVNIEISLHYETQIKCEQWLTTNQLN